MSRANCNVVSVTRAEWPSVSLSRKSKARDQRSIVVSYARDRSVLERCSSPNNVAFIQRYGV
jgi:hypothetical protein